MALVKGSNNGKQDKNKWGAHNIGARQITIIGVLTAMTLVTTVFTKIPLVIGYFNLGDTFVLLAGVLFGSLTGAFTGAVGSALADIFTGAYIFAPITFIVKGAEGYIAGKVSGGGIANNSAADSFLTKGGAIREKPARPKLMPALIVGAGVMVAGYFVAEAAVLSIFDRAFGISAAVAELPFNLAQSGISIILARVVVEGLKRTKVV